jgi:phosphoglycolate phosphatase-like HAD superfamily hydrolase
MSNEGKQGSKQENDENNKENSALNKDNHEILELLKEFLKRSFSKEDLLRILKEAISEIESERAKELEKELEKEEKVKEEVAEELKEEISKIPLVFNKELSVFESTVKFLRENKKLRYSKIGKLLKRNPRVIWITYQRANKKFPHTLTPDYSFEIPLEIISSREYSALESVVKYLHEVHNLKFSKISELLNKSYTTVHTAYARSNLKSKNKKEENAE